jgi:hypothetical protein
LIPHGSSRGHEGRRRARSIFVQSVFVFLWLSWLRDKSCVLL